MNKHDVCISDAGIVSDKKIVHIIESSATGTLAITRMAANAQVLLNNVTVLYSRRAETPQDFESLFLNDVSLIERNLSASYFPFSVFSLRRHLKRINPDIVHCHSSLAGFVGRLASIGLSVKVFYSPHCISFMREDVNQYKKLFFKLFEILACIKPSVYIACSQSEKNAIKKALPFVEVNLLENAVSLSEFNNKRDQVSKLTNDKIRVITVGGIRPQKGPAEYAQIADKFNSSNIEFIWVGDGDGQLKQILINAGVKVTGWMSRVQVIEELQKADIYLSTSLWEGMPVSVIEACAANIPVILRDCDGNKDIVVHRKNGFLFSETPQCIDLLNQYAVQRSHFKELALVAYTQAFDRFSVERFLANLARIYNS